VAVPNTADDLLGMARRTGVVNEALLDACVVRLVSAGGLPAAPADLAEALVRERVLTAYQAEQLLRGKWRRFIIGKYKILDRLGEGGMGSVFLCEHAFMRRRVAVKVLPPSRAANPSSLRRFYREARALAGLDHPNIVRAFDIDQDGALHFLVMEYLDGPTLKALVRKCGPLAVGMAADYVRQVAKGLEYGHEAVGLIHRDIKPSNLLVNARGTVKILDFGLAYFYDEECERSRSRVFSTADYLAPEQLRDDYRPDVRSDLYSLGASFYFLLTGQNLFPGGDSSEKRLSHQLRQPTPIRDLRPDVPEALAAVVDRMLAKEPDERFASPAEVAAVLKPWTKYQLTDVPEPTAV
jgi:serine/threonine protein kinase